MSVDPDPNNWIVVGVEVANTGSLPYSKYAVVESPFGFTTALRTALELVTDVAAGEVTAGERSGAESPPPPLPQFVRKMDANGSNSRANA